jgi:hypothetical protein
MTVLALNVITWKLRSFTGFAVCPPFYFTWCASRLPHFFQVIDTASLSHFSFHRLDNFAYSHYTYINKHNSKQPLWLKK